MIIAKQSSTIYWQEKTRMVNASIDEASAIELLKQLSDEELEEGMPFNEPADVADVLLEIFRS